MNRSAGVVRATLVLALGGGCTIVKTEGDAGVIVPPPQVSQDAAPPPPPPPLHAHLLYMTNLHRSSANLAGHYGNLMAALPPALEKLGLRVDRWAVAPTYAGVEGARLLLGGKGEFPVADVLSEKLKTLAMSGGFDGPGNVVEPGNVAQLGQMLAFAALPPDEGGFERDALFDQPRNLFIVVYLQPLRRRCAYGAADCRIEGRTAGDIFLEQNSDGTVAWLRFAKGGLRPGQVVHVAISTAEGESPDAFRTRCKKVPGFPQNLFDVMEPSPLPYFVPLLSALNAANPGTGQMADICDLIGSDPEEAIIKLVRGIASLAI